MAEVDDDLRDVFGSLYQGDEWDDWAEDDQEPNNTPVNVDRKASSHRYSTTQLRSALSSLLTTESSVVPAKRRIYTTRQIAPGVIPSTSPLPVVDSTAYAPFSPLPLLGRLRSFSPSTYSPFLPDAIGARAVALAGWVNNAKDGLACAGALGTGKEHRPSTSTAVTTTVHGCTAVWGVGGMEDIKDSRVRSEIARRLASSLSRRHAPGCGWRVLPSPANLIRQSRQLTHPLVASSLSPLASALQQRSLGPMHPQWKSPLGEHELEILCTALARHGNDSGHTAIVEHLAAALALFGWYPYDPSFPTDHVAAVGGSGTTGTSTRTDIVSCRLCQRRIGLWLFQADRSPSRVLDVQNDHLWWCPLGGADGEWWRECPLLNPIVHLTGVPRLSDEPPRKRLRKGPKDSESSPNPSSAIPA